MRFFDAKKLESLMSLSANRLMIVLFMMVSASFIKSSFASVKSTSFDSFRSLTWVFIFLLNVNQNIRVFKK